MQFTGNRRRKRDTEANATTTTTAQVDRGVPMTAHEEVPRTVSDAAMRVVPAKIDPLADLRALPVPPARGWPVIGGGRDHHVGSATLWQGTTSQLAGLYPFVGGSGSRVRGVPIGHDLHTHEPVGLHPGDWLKTGLISNTGMWVQAQPGVGKSAFAKRGSP